jgi:hypothetical protein
MTTFLNGFEISDIHTEPIIPDSQVPGECDLCLLSDAIEQRIVFWVYEPAEEDPEWPNGIYLLSLCICEDCHKETQHINVVHGDTVSSVIKFMIDHKTASPQPAQRFISISTSPKTVSTSIAYFSGHQSCCCDVCRTVLSGEQDLHQKIYTAVHRPKRWQPEDADYILFSFSLCKTCLEKTADETIGTARFDWDIVDFLHCLVEPPATH